MSGRLVGAVLEDRLEDAPARARQGLRAVLIVLAEAARDSGVAWPSTATIADRSLFSQRQVVRLLNQLEELGRIRASGARSGGRSRTTRWQLIPRSSEAVKGDISSPIDEAERVTSEPVKGDTQMSPEPCEPFPPLPPAERGESDHRIETQGHSSPSLPGLGRGEEGLPAIGRGRRPRAARKAEEGRRLQEENRRRRQELDERQAAERQRHEQEEAEREATREERVALARAALERVRSLPRAVAGGR